MVPGALKREKSNPYIQNLRRTLKGGTMNDVLLFIALFSSGMLTGAWLVRRETRSSSDQLSVTMEPSYPPILTVIESPRKTGTDAQ
jgi:hypothetical protein